MARISKERTLITPSMTANNTLEAVWKATYKVFVGEDGKTYVQIDTYGRRNRVVLNQPSQKLQIEWSLFVYLCRQLGVKLDPQMDLVDKDVPECQERIKIQLESQNQEG